MHFAAIDRLIPGADNVRMTSVMHCRGKSDVSRRIRIAQRRRIAAWGFVDSSRTLAVPDSM